MIKITDLTLDQYSISAGEPLLLVAIKANYKYSDNRRTEEIENYGVKVAALGKQYETVIVKVSEKPAIAENAINNAFVDFKGFEGKIYNINNNYVLSLKAKSVVLAKTQ